MYEGMTESEVREIVREELMKLSLDLRPSTRETLDGTCVENRLILSLGPAAMGEGRKDIDSVFLGS